jgi:hypothetical protein
MLLGVHENADPAVTAKMVPGHNTTRLFVPGVILPRDLVAQVQADCGPTWAAGQTAVWSFKPRPDQVANGKWRKPVQDLAAYLQANAAGARTIVVIWHEPENDVPKWFPTAAAFVNMFNVVHGWLKGVWPQLITCHAALGYRYQDLGGAGISSALAGRWRTLADLNTVDIYSGRSNPLATILPELNGFNRWFAHVATPGRWGVSERGWTCGAKDSALRAATIAREFGWLVAQPVRPDPYLVWDTVGAEGDAGLLLDKPALAAVAAGFARLDAAVPVLAPVPARTVVCPKCKTSIPLS